jgi:hypothetical protein
MRFSNISLYIYLAVGLVGSLNCTTAKTAGSNDVLFEVTTVTSESIAPAGEILDLRVFRDRRAEFDQFSSADSKTGTTEKPELKHAEITSDQLSAIESALGELDSAQIQPSYPPSVGRTVDSFIQVSIRYRSKQGTKTIVLYENDSHLHLDLKDIYPRELVNLLRLQYRIGAELRKAGKS